LKITILILIISLLLGCDSEKTQCKNPIEIYNLDEGLGYIISVNDDVDTNLLATEYIERFGNDISIYRTRDAFFTAGLSTSALNIIRCDSRIRAIEYEGLLYPVI